jgi:5-methylcytosine-specific restriction endonuclease McrA
MGGVKKHRARAIGQPCAYCAEPMTAPPKQILVREQHLHAHEVSVDHIRPRSACSPFTNIGKAPMRWDRALVCKKCNTDKGDLLLPRWLVELRLARDPRAPIVAAFIEKWLAEHSDHPAIEPCDPNASLVPVS